MLLILPAFAACSEKILKSRPLEEIRLTILNNLLLYHPESAEELNWGMTARKPSSSSQSHLGARSQCAPAVPLHFSTPVHAVGHLCDSRDRDTSV